MTKYRVIKAVTKKGNTVYQAQKRFLRIFWVDIADYWLYKDDAIDYIAKYKKRKNLPKKEIVYEE